MLSPAQKRRAGSSSDLAASDADRSKRARRQPCCGRARRLLSASGERVLDLVGDALEASMKHGGPLYVAIATFLIVALAGVWLTSVWLQLFLAKGPLALVGHLALGAVLLLGVLYNYYLCITTPPGSPKAIPGGYTPRPGEAPRTCGTCACAKPPRTHHCHICNECVLKMDHHCPWMNACVGWHNYPAFYLFSFYLELGALYAAYTCYWALVRGAVVSRSGYLIRYDRPLMAAFVLSAAVSISISLLLLAHTHFVLAGQSTIEWLRSWGEAREARRRGAPWRNSHSLGPALNWQEAFDVRGLRFWWVRWLLPPARRRLGTGAHFPVPADEQPAAVSL